MDQRLHSDPRPNLLLLMVALRVSATERLGFDHLDSLAPSTSASQSSHRRCRVALVHEPGSALRRNLHQCLPGEAAGPNVTIFPATHGGECHPECMREGFLREPGTMTPCPNHAGGIGRRHDLLGRGVRVVLPAHKEAGWFRHTSVFLALMATASAT